MQHILLYFLIITFSGGVWGQATSSNVAVGEHIEVALHSEVQSVQVKQPFWVALRLTPEHHWHTYWQNPGDSGTAPRLRWDLAVGSQASDIHWPAPQRIAVQHLLNFGYAGEAWLLVQITPPAQLDTPEFTMTAHLNWLVCKEACIPGKASLTLSLPVTETAQPEPRWQAQFAQVRAALPKSLGDIGTLTPTEQGLRLRLTVPQTALQKLQQAWFFPIANDLLEHAAAQPMQIKDGKLFLQLQPSAYFSGLADTYAGVLRLDEAAYAISVKSAPSSTAAFPSTTSFPSTSSGNKTGEERAETSKQSLWLIGLLAFVGGLLLNLMPCVFPVLSLKALSLLQHSQAEQRQQRLHGLAYTLGVLLSFLAIAALLLLLQAAGSQVGWGFQLQNPVFIVLLVYVLFALALSLSGLLHFGQHWMGSGESLTQRGGYPGSFFTGVLAVLVASPCTAPFMGTALGYAVTQPALIALLVFTLLGLGMAAPFLLLSFSPRLLRYLPKPGAWMESFKQFMAFPLYATVLWLLWVLGRQVGVDGMTAALGGLLLLSLALWLWAGKTTWWRKVTVIILIITALSLLTLPLFQTAERQATTATPQAYSAQRLQDLLAQDKSVFVNLTAAWCITCLVNEQVALSRESVQQAFAEQDIVYLKGDWTNYDAEITELLAQFGRNGVPLYLLYRPKQETQVLPQILTPSIVLQALNPPTSAAATSF